MERADRNFGELLQELRVAQTGVQILFAFLLSLSFMERFEDVTPFQSDVYVVTLVSCAVTTALLIAPETITAFVACFFLIMWFAMPTILRLACRRRSDR